MANKSTGKKKNSASKKVTKAVGKTAKNMSKKQVKSLVIATVAVVLIIALAVGVFYIVNPQKFKEVWNSFFGNTLPTTTLEGDVMEVRFLDVGQGDCIIIRLPDGKNMIIDAGGTKSKNSESAESVILDEIKKLGIDTFDYMMATHSDADHVDYLDSVLKVTQVNKVFRPAFSFKYADNSIESGRSEYAVVSTITYRNFILSAMQEPNCELVDNIGHISLSGSNYEINIYAPPKSEYTKAKVGEEPDAKEKNRVSPIVYLTYGGRTVVFTGDSESEDGGNSGEEMLIKAHNLTAKKVDCDVLKVGHHGSEYSSGMTFLNMIDVEYAVISVGVDNSHRHPRPELIDRLNAYRDQEPDGDGNGIQKIYRTDKDGSVLLKVGLNGGMQWASF